MLCNAFFARIHISMPYSVCKPCIKAICLYEICIYKNEYTENSISSNGGISPNVLCYAPSICNITSYMQCIRRVLWSMVTQIGTCECLSSFAVKDITEISTVSDNLITIWICSFTLFVCMWMGQPDHILPICVALATFFVHGHQTKRKKIYELVIYSAARKQQQQQMYVVRWVFSMTIFRFSTYISNIAGSVVDHWPIVVFGAI